MSADGGEKNKTLPNRLFHLRSILDGLSRIGCGWFVHAAAQNARRLSMFEGIFQPTHLLVIFGIALLVF